MKALYVKSKIDIGFSLHLDRARPARNLRVGPTLILFSLGKKYFHVRTEDWGKDGFRRSNGDRSPR